MEARPPVSLDLSPDQDRACDVLDSGSRRDPRLTPAARRRLRLSSVVIVAAAVAVGGGVELQDRRDAAAEDRRLAGLLRLSAPEGRWRIMWIADPPPSTQSLGLLMRVFVRNDGPRPVTVTQASAGGFVFLLAPVAVPAKATVELLMQQEAQCGADTPPLSDDLDARWPLAPGPLQITARTSSGTRTITLARPPYETEHAATACALLRNTPRPPFDG